MADRIHVPAGSVSTDRAVSRTVPGHVVATGAGARVIRAASGDEGRGGAGRRAS